MNPFGCTRYVTHTLEAKSNDVVEWQMLLLQQSKQREEVAEQEPEQGEQGVNQDRVQEQQVANETNEKHEQGEPQEANREHGQGKKVVDNDSSDSEVCGVSAQIVNTGLEAPWQQRRQSQAMAESSRVSAQSISSGLPVTNDMMSQCQRFALSRGMLATASESLQRLRVIRPAQDSKCSSCWSDPGLDSEEQEDMAREDTEEDLEVDNEQLADLDQHQPVVGDSLLHSASIWEINSNYRRSALSQAIEIKRRTKCVNESYNQLECKTRRAAPLGWIQAQTRRHGKTRKKT